MPPGKRKRGDRTYSQDVIYDGQRPSPHRPANTNLGQQSREQEQSRNKPGGYGAGHRQNRAGRGGFGARNDGINNPEKIDNVTIKSPATPSSIPSTSVPHNARAEQSTAPLIPTQPTTPAVQPLVQPAQAEEQKIAIPEPPYVYDFITDEAIGTWTEGGQQKVINLGIKARRDEDTIALSTLYQELITCSQVHRLSAAEAGTAVKDIIGAAEVSDNTSFDAQLLFLDTLSILTEQQASEKLHALRPFIIATAIPPSLLRQNLSYQLLEALGLVRNTFVKIYARKTTNLLYRQANFNLLREETEGYSKLMTELFTTSNNEPPTSEIVEATFERVTALIGAFDLDVGRVLDITLDVFASVLVKQNRFYVKFLRASSWWPKDRPARRRDDSSHYGTSLPLWALPGAANRDLNTDERKALARFHVERDKAFWSRVKEDGIKAFFRIGRDATADRGTGTDPNDEDESVDHDSYRKWIEETGTFPPSGNRIAAQLLGFKLRFYASSVRDPTDTFPPNLIYLAALLIKIGFISLQDLYAHLWPQDEDMETVKLEQMKENEEREKANRPGGGVPNALMMAGALSDDTPSAANRSREMDPNRGSALQKADASTEKANGTTKPESKGRISDAADNQKVLLLKSLLCIGAIPESLFMLGRFPWLIDAFSDLPEYIHRILHHSLQAVYDTVRPLQSEESLHEAQKIADPDQSGVPKGQLKLMDVPARRCLRWAQLDKEDTNDGTDYRFYWDDWADNVPVCQSVDDVFLLCKTFLNLSGVKIGTDPALLIKLARIGRKSLADDTSETNLNRWVDLSKRLLVPALSLTKTNPGVVNEVFDLLKCFSTGTRYSIYAEWYAGSASRLPDVKSAFAQAKAETKNVLRRISKTNVKHMARALAKVAYASPGVVFDVAIGQIESYDNLVEVVVECARYFTYLGYDVLTWALMSHLGGKGRNRVQADGMLTSKWLAALALFAGRVFKRYSALMNPTPILQYVLDQLTRSNSVDLIVLKEMTTSMAGIVPDTNFNQSQSLAMAGGDLLRQQTLLQLLDKRHESRTTAKRLMKALADPKIAGQLLIAIAQERQTCIFGLPEPDAHLKLLGNLSDEIHRVLAQYIDFLRSNLSFEEFDALVPTVPSLILDFGIDPNIAFWIGRPSIVHQMKEATDAAAAQTTPEDPDRTTTPTASDKDGDIAMSAEQAYVASAPANETSRDETGKEDITDVSAGEALGDTIAAAKETNGVQPWHPVLSELMDSLSATLPEKAWNTLSLSFYVTFWQLSLYDVQVPTKSYEEEVTRLKHKWIAVRDDRTDMSIAGVAKKEREKKHLTDMQDQLRHELKSHIQAFSVTRSRLTKEKDHWFLGFWGRWEDLNDSIIQYCLVPRLVLSSNDALYCFKMLKFLHSSGTPNFRTMGLLDHLLRHAMLANLIFILTSQEAEHFGLFLNEILKDLSRWHADKAVYDKEALGAKKNLPGFARKVTKDIGPETFLEYEDFRRLLYKWHLSINSALKSCLTGGEYMHIRNAIIVLKSISQHFPAVNWNGRDQVTSIVELSKTEKREDLKIAATSVLGSLKKREKQWQLPQAFRSSANVERGESSVGGNVDGRGRSNSASVSTPPQARSGSQKPLSATATEFQPRSQPNVNGTIETQISLGKPDVEDGEIDDAKAATDPVRPEADPTAVPIVEGNPSPGPSAPEPKSEASAEKSVKRLRSRQPTPTDQAVPQRDGQPVSNPAASDRQTSKPGDGAPRSEDVSIRPGPTQNSSTGGTAGRGLHNLPNRPDMPTGFPPRSNDRRHLDRPDPDRHLDRREARDAQVGGGRYDRAPDHGRDSNLNRRSEAMAPNNRGLDRPGDVSGAGGRDRRDGKRAPDGDFAPRMDNIHSRPSSSDSRPGRPPREWNEPESRLRPINDARNGHRGNDAHALYPRDGPMAPPRPGIPAHPDRAALIVNEGDRPHERPGPDREFRRDHPARPLSPRQADERRNLAPPGRPDGRREDRMGNRPAMHDRVHPPERGGDGARYEDLHTPTGPKGDRPSRAAADSASDAYERPAESFASRESSRSQDFDRRQSQETRLGQRQQDPNYGRLNPVPDVPAGPRHANTNNRGGRNSSNVQGHSNTRQADSSGHPSAATTPSDHHPAASAATPSRTSARVAASQSAQKTSSAPATPAAAKAPENRSAELTGIHPDRLKGIQRAPDLSDTNRSSPHVVTNSSRAAAGSGPPSGPRHAQQQQPPQSPVGQSPTSRMPPTGPASVGDRGRGDKRFAGLQNVLQQQAGASTGPERNERAPTNRIGGGRSASGSEPHQGGPAPIQSNTRPDLIVNRQNGQAIQKSDDERQAPRRGRPRDGGFEEGETRRSGRHKTSRPSSQDRGVPRHVPDDRPPRREEYQQDRRGGAPREERGSRRGRGDEPRDRHGGRDGRDHREPDNSRGWGGPGSGPGPGPGPGSGPGMGSGPGPGQGLGPGPGGRDSRGGGGDRRNDDRERDFDRERDGSRRDSRKRPRGIEEPPPSLMEREKRPRRNQ
ncbi:MAG: hypothetical protein M1825_005107 [Sarcosagium campestre]|nr:MAG: hypothetical protein M1825_005107 [Sarcosagium campestre]